MKWGIDLVAGRLEAQSNASWPDEKVECGDLARKLGASYLGICRFAGRRSSYSEFR